MIATQLTKDKVLTPTAYKQKQGLNTPQATPENPSKWHQTTVRKILERREYTGCIVNFKTFTNSIWDKKKRDNPVENHSVFYDTHKAIIPEDIFEKVQVLRQNRQRRSKTGKTSLFSGMAYCADCGEKLYYCTVNNFEKRQDFFECSTHRKNDEKCKSHYIRAVVQEQLKIESDEKIQAWRKQRTQAEKRIAELDRLFVKTYEDNAKGKLSDERFSMMSGNYEAEQKKLRMDAVELQKNIEEQERQNGRLENFIQKAKHYQDLNSLTPDALRDMVSAIYVGAPDKSSGKRQQKIEIYYDGAGFIPLNLLMQRETA